MFHHTADWKIGKKFSPVNVGHQRSRGCVRNTFRSLREKVSLTLIYGHIPQNLTELKIFQSGSFGLRIEDGQRHLDLHGYGGGHPVWQAFLHHQVNHISLKLEEWIIHNCIFCTQWESWNTGWGQVPRKPWMTVEWVPNWTFSGFHQSKVVTFDPTMDTLSPRNKLISGRGGEVLTFHQIINYYPLQFSLFWLTSENFNLLKFFFKQIWKLLRHRF